MTAILIKRSAVFVISDIDEFADADQRTVIDISGFEFNKSLHAKSYSTCIYRPLNYFSVRQLYAKCHSRGIINFCWLRHLDKNNIQPLTGRDLRISRKHHWNLHFKITLAYICVISMKHSIHPTYGVINWFAGENETK